MTCVFDLQTNKSFVNADMEEWRARFPFGSDQRPYGMTVMNAWRSGMAPNQPEDMPKVLVLDRPMRTQKDAFKTVNALHVVSQRAKDVIEEFDRGRHQFFPLEIRTKRDVVVEGPWFSMNVHTIQDSIIVEKSRVVINKRNPDELCSFAGFSKKGGVVVDPSRQSGVHLWREKRFRGSLLGSDALVAELKAQGVKFFPAFQAKNLEADNPA